jgi:hypothetical protein
MVFAIRGVGNGQCGSLELYRNLNDIRVRSFILTGAPIEIKGLPEICQLNLPRRCAWEGSGKIKEAETAIDRAWDGPALPYQVGLQSTTSALPCRKRQTLSSSELLASIREITHFT